MIMIGYFLVAIVSIVTGLIEARRIWLYVRHGRIEFHRLYQKEINRIEEKKGRQASEEYKKDLEEHWWRHQGVSSLFVAVTTILAGIVVIYLLIT
jgi:hypothetical protein